MPIPLRLLRLRSPLLLPSVFAFASLVAAADWATGPLVQFPILYVFPVMVAAWLGFPRLAIGIAIVLPILRAIVEQELWQGPPPLRFTVLNATTYAGVLLALAGLTATVAATLRRVAALEGMLPLCRVCKRIRTEGNRWEALDVYIARQAHTSFSSGTCPDCLRRVFGTLMTS